MRRYLIALALSGTTACAPSALAVRGQELYAANGCAACHGSPEADPRWSGPGPSLRGIWGRERRAADGSWRVKDFSNNGTFLNGHRISGETPVKDGDALGLGQFQVLIRTSAEGLNPDEATDVSRPELLGQRGESANV